MQTGSPWYPLRSTPNRQPLVMSLVVLVVQTAISEPLVVLVVQSVDRLTPSPGGADSYFRALAVLVVTGSSGNLSERLRAGGGPGSHYTVCIHRKRTQYSG